MYIGADRELPFGFVLELDGARFASNDASFRSYSYGNIYKWKGTGLSWKDGDTVEVRLLRAFEDETAVNSTATGAPIVSGTVQVGETLTADTSGIEDADGLNNAAFTYQWLADNAAIAGASGSTYTLADADEGKAIAVQVSFTDDAGNDETLASAATETVSFAVQPQVANSPATGAPTISGTVQVGETLTADTSGIADENGLENLTFTYQWLAEDDVIAGATDSTYTLADADEGKAIKVHVSFTDDAGNDETLTSAATDAVAAPEPPAKPTGLSATPSHDRVVLTWDDPNDDTITGYVILRRNRETDAQGQFTNLVEDTGAAATTYTDDTVEPETPYTYRIKAINEHGESERSRWFHIDTPAAPLLAAPTGVGSAVSSDTVMLIWANPQDDNITGYRILRRDGDAQAGGEFTTIASDTGSAATTYTDDTVEPERVYVYRVLAISPQGVSEPSRDVEVSTAAPVAPPEPLRSLRAHAGSTLLTNLGQDGKEGDALTAGADDLALGFTTGSNAGGYNLSGVRLDLAEVPVSPEDVSVELWSATGGATPAPQARIATLTHSTGTLVTGENTFYAPAGTTLQAGTIYFVFLSYGGSSATGFDLGITESTSADASSAPGWSLGQLFSRTRTPTGTWSASSGTLLVKFGILGGEPIEATLEPGDSVSGTFDPFTWYYFALDGLTSGRYTVSFSKGAIEAIYAAGNLITDQPHGAATYTFDVRSTGTPQTRYVWLVVRGDAGSYTVSLDETMPDLVVGGPPAAGRIRVLPDISAPAGGPWGTSMQFFPVELEAGVVYQVDIKGVDTGDGTMDYPMLANIAAPDGSYVGGTTHLFVQGGGEGRNVRYVFTADQDGMYFLKAGGALWKITYIKDGVTGRYTLYRAGTFTVSIQETGGRRAAH